jgi:Anti-sigma-K factor rskA
MAVALAIAAGIIAIDLSHELVSRISHYRSRIASLNKRVDTLKREAVADEKRLADAREEIKQRKLMESKDRMKAILIAPDRKTIKLAAPNAGELATATVTISEKIGGAVLSARGLASPPEGQVYDAWWMLKSAPPAKAAEFRSGIDGSASEYLDPPPQGSAPVLLLIALEPSGGIAPSGPVKLQGKVPAGIAEERNGGVKKH